MFIYICGWPMDIEMHLNIFIFLKMVPILIAVKLLFVYVYSKWGHIRLKLHSDLNIDHCRYI